jgi:hypothetical protein
MRAVFAFPAVILAATGALADVGNGAHFMGVDGSVNNNGQLVVTFSEAGLGTGQITYSLTGNTSATWACINHGDKHPQASNKATINPDLVATGTFQPKHGRVDASLTYPPDGAPSAPSNFGCPGGQQMVFACVSYTNLVLTDTNNGDWTYVSGSTSRTFVPGIKGIDYATCT